MSSLIFALACAGVRGRGAGDGGHAQRQGVCRDVRTGRHAAQRTGTFLWRVVDIFLGVVISHEREEAGYSKGTCTNLGRVVELVFSGPCTGRWDGLEGARTLKLDDVGVEP